MLRARPNLVISNVVPPGPETIAGRTLDVDSLSLGLSDATPVPSWADTSGAGHDLTQLSADPALYPNYYTTGGVDSQPFLGFPTLVSTGGSSQTQLGNATITTDRQSFSAFFVVTPTDLADTKSYLSLGGGSVIVEIVDGILTVFASAVGSQPTTFLVPTGRKVAILVTSSASALKVYFEAAANVQTLAPLTAGTATGLLYPGDPSVILHQAYRLVTWSRALSGAEAVTLFAYAASVYGTGGCAAAPTGRVGGDGDSTCFGAANDRSHNWMFYLAPGNGYYPFCVGRNGATTQDLIDDHYSWPAAGPNSWFVAMVGVNDLNGGATAADTEAGYASVFAGVQAQGTPKANCIALTLSCANALGGRRDAYNALKRAGYAAYAGHLVDLAADPVVGVIEPNGGLRTPAIWDGGGTHPFDACSILMAAKIRADVPGLP